MPNSELEFDAEYFVDDLTDEQIIELVELNEWEPDFGDEDEDIF
jgi:hypothetical protein